MSIVGALVGFGLRQALNLEGDAVIGFIENRFTDHSQTLPKALARANHRAWQALAVALAGDGFLDQVKVWFASGDDKGIREQVGRFLAGQMIQFDETPADFRKACLSELKEARKAGLLSAKQLLPAEVAKQTASFQRFTDPTGLIDGAWQTTARIADALAPQHEHLAKLFRQSTPDGPPLLVAAFVYFFRREVETDDELANGLMFDGLRQLSAAQAKAFGEVEKALTSLGDRFDQVLEQLGRIETVVVEIQAVAGATHGALLDMQGELRRMQGELRSQGNQHSAIVDEMRRLLQETMARVAQLGMQFGEVRPHHSLSIRSEGERQYVKQLVEQFRRLPPELQQQAPALLNGLGKLQIGAGDFDGARQTFLRVAHSTTDASAKAEAHYNAYRAALEKRDWDAALAALKEAAAFDAARFTPFPLNRYEPQRILGAGGFGTAFLCHDANFAEDVVVKTLHADDMERSMAEVFQEARILRKLSHAAIIGVHECAFADPLTKTRPYIVMDYFPGVSLEVFVRERGTLSTDAFLAVGKQLAAGMHAAHEQKVLHRDLKPENVLVRKEGEEWRVKIIDFGLALRKQTIETSGGRLGNTVLGESVAGTVKYAPPEQMGELKGVKPGPYSDVYSFGKLCCFGLFKTTEPKRKHWDGIPRGLADFLESCLEEQPVDRPASFRVVLERLSPAEPAAPSGSVQQQKDLTPSSVLTTEPGPATTIIPFAEPCLDEGTSQATPEPQPGEVVTFRPARNAVLDTSEAIADEQSGDKALQIDFRDYQQMILVGGRSRTYLEQAVKRIPFWKDAAKRNSPVGQWFLGVCLGEGIGFAKDHSQAVKWFRKAADQGFASAQFHLGVMYRLGQGVPQDDSQAVQWFRRAADQGLADAQNHLGEMYQNRRGVPRDYTQAVHLYRKASGQGHVGAQYNLGRMFEHGRGEPRDDTQAVTYYLQSAEKGYALAQNHLGEMYEYGLGVARDLVRASQWYSTAAENPNSSQSISDAAKQNLARLIAPHGGTTATAVSHIQSPTLPSANRPPSPSSPSPQGSPPSHQPWEIAWSLFERLKQVFAAPFLPLVTAVQRANSVSEMLNAREPEQFSRACSEAITAVVQMRNDPFWSNDVRQRLAALDAQRFALLAFLEPTLQLIQNSNQAVSGLNLPDDCWSEIVGSTAGAPLGSTATLAALGAAVGSGALGTFLLPGIGTAIGVTLGAMVRGNHQAQQNKAVVEKCDLAFAQIVPVIEEVLSQVWSHVTVVSPSSVSFPAYNHFLDAGKAWGQLSGKLTLDPSSAQEIRSFLDQWGPYPSAVHQLFKGCLHFGWEQGISEARFWVQMHRSLFPTHPETFQMAGDWLLAENHYQEALRCIDAGLLRRKDHLGLNLSKIDATSALGRTDEAVRLAADLTAQTHTHSAWLSAVGGAARTGDLGRVVAVVRDWLRLIPDVPAVARELRHDFILERHFTSIADEITELQPFGGTLKVHLPAIVRAYLTVDRTRTFFCQPTGDKGTNASREFLQLGVGEDVLYFYDWSMFGNGTIGLALTTVRLLWKCTWENPVAIPYRGLALDKLKLNGNVLTVAGAQVDVGSTAIAKGVMASLFEILIAVNASSS